MKKHFILIILFVQLLGCAAIETSDATHILVGDRYPATEPESIEILFEKPDKEYLVIGMIESRGIGMWDEARDMHLSMKALRTEAAKIGANAVLIKSSEQQITGISNGVTSTERRISGVAIRYK